MPKVYSLTVRNRAIAAVLAIGVLGVGAVLVTIGLALLVGLVVGGLVLGTGYAAYLRLRRGRRLGARQRFGQSGDLDPALEVRSSTPAIVSTRNALPDQTIDRQR
jgi:hypothetical protein